LPDYQNFLQHYSIFLSFQQNYFDGPTKSFSDLYPAKILDLSANSFRVYSDKLPRRAQLFRVLLQNLFVKTSTT